MSTSLHDALIKCRPTPKQTKMLRWFNCGKCLVPKFQVTVTPLPTTIKRSSKANHLRT